MIVQTYKNYIQEINMRAYIMQLYFHDKYVYNKTNLYLFIFNACRVWPMKVIGASTSK